MLQGEDHIDVKVTAFCYLPPMPDTGTALVTGATEGIGRATALALGRAGYRVAACARTPARVEALVAELRACGIEAAGASADVADEIEIGRAVASLTEVLGDVDVLVNNAGVLIGKPLEELTLDEWDRTMATNLRGLFLTTRLVLPGMRTRRRGTIVNVASLSGRSGFAGGTAYAASKHGVLGFSRSLMLEVRKDGVRVVAVCPGSVATGMLRDQPMLKSDPKRILRPEDVADVILQAVRLPERAMVSELDIRPTNP
jgi:3-oxoacyl-[acyl-carrier protein] reductase